MCAVRPIRRAPEPIRLRPAARDTDIELRVTDEDTSSSQAAADLESSA